jgi:hypothetical protein
MWSWVVYESITEVTCWSWNIFRPGRATDFGIARLREVVVLSRFGGNDFFAREVFKYIIGFGRTLKLTDEVSLPLSLRSDLTSSISKFVISGAEN